MYRGFRRTLSAVIIVLGIWLFVQIVLPLCFPLLLGALLALGAEPMVGFLNRRVKLPRAAAAGMGVTAALCFLVLLVLFLGALILRELAALVSVMPNLEAAATQGISTLTTWALSLIGKLPSGIREILSQGIQDFFSGSSQMLRSAFGYVVSLTGGILRQVPDSALVLGTGVISAYMISGKLPGIKEWIKGKLSRERIQKFLGSAKRLKGALFGWMKAQIKLMGITWVILTLGFVVLRIPYAPLWAAAVSLVDAFPILGVGTVLLPWSLVYLVQADQVRAVGMLGIYGVIALSRSVLEPKLLGSHLGLDPLVTLGALYAGYKLWGFGGMILAPVIAVAAVQLIKEPEG